MVDYKEFSQTIKTKYPQYADVEDKLLAEKMIAKYPQYAERVTFNDANDLQGQGTEKQPFQIGVEKFDWQNVPEQIKKDPKQAIKDMKQNISNPVTDAWKSGIQGLSSLGVGLGKNIGNKVLRPLVGKQPLNEEQLDNVYNWLDDAPKNKLTNFIGETAPYFALPSANVFKGAGMGSQVGNLGLTGAYQGATIGGLESLKNEGNLSGMGSGALIGGGLGAGLPAVGVPLTKAIPWVGERLGMAFGGIKPATLKQLIKPNSRALDLDEGAAQNLLMNTTEQVRNDYNALLQKKGQAVQDAAQQINNSDQRILIDNLTNDITNVFDKYSGDKINPARNMTGDLEQSLKELVQRGAGDTLPATFSIRNGQWINDQGVKYNQLGHNVEDAQLFAQALKNAKNSRGILGEQVYEYPLTEYQKMDLFLSPDAKSGVAIKPDGDIVSVFSHSDTPKGTGANVIDLATSAGGKKLDAFDTFLPEFYGKHGFKTYKSEKWNDAYASKNWDKEYFAKYNNGEPDIKYMALDELTASPVDVNKTKQQIGHMVNWSDEAARNYKNPILEQIYGKFANRLSALSPELANANKAYSNLQAFQKNEGLRRILKPGDYIDSASSALKNYNSTVTKGNTGRNIKDLEQLLVNEGYSPFLNNIDDVNAAMDLLNSHTTGRNFMGVTDLTKSLLLRPIFRGIRRANQLGIPEKYNRLKEYVRPNIVKLLMGSGYTLGD